MEKLILDLENKLKTLRFREKKTDEVLTKNERPALERQRASLNSIVKAINNVKENIEEKKFSNGEDETEIGEWSQSVEDQLVAGDQAIDRLTNALKNLDIQDRQAEAYEKHKQNLKFEKELWEQKAALGQESAPTHVNDSPVAAKLPKLVISRFDGKIQNWLSFYGKFTSEIDSSNLPALTKFGYLKESLEDHVKSDIDGLPFNEQGYADAKAILEAEYGNTSEIVSTYVRNIMDLPVINGASPKKVKEFYKELRYNVQSLETMGKLGDVKGNVRATLDKLKGIKSDLLRGNDDWRNWDFKDLLKELKRWTDINQVEEGSEKSKGNSVQKSSASTNLYNTRSKSSGQSQVFCVYCDGSHKAKDCTNVTDVRERKKLLSSKKLCFNCAIGKHRADSCPSKGSCFKCKRRHHTSICDSSDSVSTSNSEAQMLIATHGKDQQSEQSTVIYPVVIVDVEGIKCRGLLDTGAGSSYASAALLDRLKRRATTKQVRRIDMMLNSTTREVELSNIQVSSLDKECTLSVEVTKVHKSELLFLDNPNYQQLINSYDHLSGVEMDDTDKKAKLPVHLILGASEFAKVKTSVAARIGEVGQPVAEWTKFGWTILSPGKEPISISNMMFCQTSQADFEELCKLDVLGIEDKTSERNQSHVYDEFKEQLSRSEEGWYETCLPWRGDHPPLPNNKEGSLQRLNSLTRKLDRMKLTDQYGEIIEEQLQEGIIERADFPSENKEFYIPHKPVIREEAESSKLRIVYDASARAEVDAPSLNECLYTGPPLQTKLFDVIVRGRFNPVLITGDLRRAFHQVRIRAQDRDAMRFHWRRDGQSTVDTLRFTRALFGLSSSPFLLGGVIEAHLTSWEDREREIVDKLRKELYVDDLISGAPSVSEALEIKRKTTDIFQDAGFKLHKWHSNVKDLEPESSEGSEQEDCTYAKQQLPKATKSGRRSLLGLEWDTDEDTLHVKIPQESSVVTKRGILAKLAKIYDPLGLLSPVTLVGKNIYRAVCDEKVAWDTQLSSRLAKLWKRWEESLPRGLGIPRSIPLHREQIQAIELHAFGDASAQGVAACLYSVIHQSSGTSQGLVAARSRLSKAGLTIPRLELVSGHMAVNLSSNVRGALEGYPISKTVCWLDSTVALYWIKGKGDYLQFVANRVQKINSHDGVLWRHVASSSNPADLASRGGQVTNAKLWWRGPEWLSDEKHWPEDAALQPSQESKAEAKLIRQVLGLAVETEEDRVAAVLKKHSLHKALRIVAWIRRFVNNALPSRGRDRLTGPLKTEETQRQRLFWIKKAQEDCDIEQDRVSLNLQPNVDGVLECHGRVQGEYPIYLPDDHLFTRRLVEDAHLRTLHGGVGTTLAKVRGCYWVPRLRRLVKKVRGACHGCMRFRAQAYAAPPPASLPTSRTQGTNAYQVIGVDYAGPIKYLVKKSREGKAYVLLYGCSLTRGVYLDLLPNLEMTECLHSLKRFIARRGRPNKIYSDNGRTFVGVANWMRGVMKDEKIQNFLCENQITWQFNLSRAPWWGGQFERLVGLLKAALYKTIGNGMLRWKELEEVLLDIEVALNNRPLDYVEDDVEFPLLTPNTLLFTNSNTLPEQEPHRVEDSDLRKRAKHLRRCKDAMWRRWQTEYLRGLRERHRALTKTAGATPNVGEVVIIKDEEKNRGKWTLGIVESLIVGRDGVARGARLRAGKTYLERPVQLLYPLELKCDRKSSETTPLNPSATEFRPRRQAAEVARQRVRECLEAEGL